MLEEQEETDTKKRKKQFVCTILKIFGEKVGYFLREEGSSAKRTKLRRGILHKFPFDMLL